MVLPRAHLVPACLMVVLTRVTNFSGYFRNRLHAPPIISPFTSSTPTQCTDTNLTHQAREVHQNSLSHSLHTVAPSSSCLDGVLPSSGSASKHKRSPSDVQSPMDGRTDGADARAPKRGVSCRTRAEERILSTGASGAEAFGHWRTLQRCGRWKKVRLRFCRSYIR